MAAASTRVWTPSLARMLETWTLAVLGLMNSAWAIWRLLPPAPTRARTSASRGVKRVCEPDPAGIGMLPPWRPDLVRPPLARLAATTERRGIGRQLARLSEWVESEEAAQSP